MRILYHHRTKSRDGQAVHIRELVGALRARGHEVLEWALSPTDSEEMGSEGGRLGALASRLPRVVYEVAEHAYGPLVAPRLAAAGRAFDAQVLYERHALGNTAGVRAARALGVPLLLEVNSPLAHERAATRELVLQRWATRSERRVLGAADRVLAVTRVLAGMLAELGVERERIAVVPNGVALERYPLDAVPAHEGVVIGFVGFFRPWHGIEALVDALADGGLPPPARLLLVGDGPSRASIEARARARGVAHRVRVTGAVGRDAVPGLVLSMDVCVQPAATPYASPLKLFEYMGAGKAIVAVDQPNLREVLAHGDNALLVPRDDPAALARALARLVEDAPLRETLGRRARETVEARELTWDGNARRVVEIAHACLVPAAPAGAPR